MLKNHPTTLFLLLIIFFFPNASFAQQNIYAKIKEAETLWEQNPENYLSTINHFSQNIDSLNKRERSTYYELMLTYQSFLCNYESTLSLGDRRIEERNDKWKENKIDTTTLKNHTPVKADSFILKKAEATNIILINESHHIPYHRVFVISLLEGLKKRGYNYLALETFKDQAFNKSYPQFLDGYYSREPLYGEMIRQALKLGFKIVEYESREKCNRANKAKYHCSNLRDSIQAININKIFEEDKEAKVIVYAGYSHIKETYTGGSKRMGFYLNELNFKPLSIDQTKMNQHLNPKLENEIYQGLNQSLDYASPIVMLDENEKVWTYTDRIDVTVFHPRLSKDGNRYAFYSINGKRKKHYLNLEQFREEDNTLLVQAFYKNEKRESRIPADQIITEAKEETPYLLLYPDDYEVVFRNSKGKIIDKIFIEE